MKGISPLLRLTALVALALISSTATAGEKLSWEDCVERTVKQNADIRASREQLESSKDLAKAAYSGFLPQITANANVNRGNSFSFSQLGGVPLNVSAGDNTVSSASVSLSQNIFNGFADSSLVEQGIASADLSSATLDATKVQISFNLKTSFADLYYAQRYRELTEQIIKRREENANLVELHFEGGIENMGSVMLARAFVSQARYDRTVAGDSIDVSREKLASVMGVESSREIDIVGGIPLVEPGAEPDFREIAPQTPQHKQSVATERVNEVGVELSRSNFYPSVDLTGTLAAQGNNSFPNSSKRSFMLNVALPIFTGGKDYYDLKSASAQYAAASFQRMSVDQQLMPNLKQAFRGYTEAIEKLKVDKAFLEAAEVRAEIARSKYNNGLLSFEDWDIIENDLITKQKTYLQSERNRITAEANWELAAGKGVIP
ncbi:MAG: TolC family protein [bacterium]